MNWNTKFGSAASRWMAVALSLLLVPFLQPGLNAQTPGFQPLDAMQLNQLVAPIALYPDSLVAQILTASTYPQQVGDANNWMHQNGGMPPDQLAGAVNGMPWDPSVQALTEFPSVLDNMARNYNWTAALGNAYYNQPGDVMNAVQAMRFQAQQAGNLRTTPQQRVYYDGGQILIAPVNPAFVYVPYYNPWGVYGMAISPWGGYYLAPPPRGIVMGVGFGLGFGVGISLGVFSHYGWGYHAWAPNWGGGVVVYNHNTYISRSTTVVNSGRFGGYNRGVYEHAGPGVPHGNFHAAPMSRMATYGHGGNAPAPSGYNRPGNSGNNQPGGGYNRPAASPTPGNRPGNSGYNQPGGGYNRPAASPTPANRPAPGGYNRPPTSQPQGQPGNRPQPQYHPQASAPQAHQAPAPQAHQAPAPQPHGQAAAPQGGGGHGGSHPQKGGEAHR